MRQAYDRSKFAAGWEPPIVCAKLVGPGCLDGPFAMVPFGAPNPQLVPLPRALTQH